MVAAAWLKFATQLQCHLIFATRATGNVEKSASKQVNTLLYCMGEEAEAVLASTNATEDDQKTYATVLAKFDEFFLGMQERDLRTRKGYMEGVR